MSSLFQRAENNAAFLKAGLMGFAGAGKSHTAALIAIGLAQAAKKKKMPYADRPVFMIDTEGGSDYLVELFEKKDVDFHVAKTRAFADLREAMAEAEKNACAFIIDSISHFWIEFQDAYAARKKRRRGLEFSDWAHVKREWKNSFTTPFLESNLHIIMCGRASYEYDHHERDDGKKEIHKSGVKMAAEKEMGFEPSLLVFMERDTDIDGHTTRKAIVMKDRFDVLDGAELPNPTFKSFVPHIQKLQWGKKQSRVGAERTSEHIIDPDIRDDRSTDRAIAFEVVKNLLSDKYGRSDDDQKAKRIALRQCFGTDSLVAIEKKISLDDLHRGSAQLMQWIDAGAIEGELAAAGAIDDEIPGEPPSNMQKVHNASRGNGAANKEVGGG